MKTHIFNLNSCSHAKGVCVVIDVLRAFTTAAYAFHQGATKIFPVSSPQEALQRHKTNPSLLLMGEEHGRIIPGFHYGNSPAEIQRASLTGKALVHRTSCGTQGVLACRHADQILLSSFVVAEATFRQISAIDPSDVSFIVTGTKNGDEDLALAEYLQERLLNREVSPSPYLDRVKNSPSGQRFLDPAVDFLPKEDLELSLMIDRFSFAMEVVNEENQLVAIPVL